MDVARSAPQGAHYLADVIYFRIKKGAMAFWYSELSLHQLGFRPTVFIPRWTTYPCILYQVCATRGVAVGVRARSDRKLGCMVQSIVHVQSHLADRTEVQQMLQPPLCAANLTTGRKAIRV